MFRAWLTARNFRQFGDRDVALHTAFKSGMIALVGRNDSRKVSIIDAIRATAEHRTQSYLS
jgi:predicted ATP-dependent endonuclease of OLD family